MRSAPQAPVFAGGIRNATTLFNHTVPEDWSHEEPAKEIALIAAAAGAGSDVLGQFTAVPIQNLCVLHNDFITVFVTAGIPQEPAKGAGTINIIRAGPRG